MGCAQVGPRDKHARFYLEGEESFPVEGTLGRPHTYAGMSISRWLIRLFRKKIESSLRKSMNNKVGGLRVSSMVEREGTSVSIPGASQVTLFSPQSPSAVPTAL